MKSLKEINAAIRKAMKTAKKWEGSYLEKKIKPENVKATKLIGNLVEIELDQVGIFIISTGNLAGELTRMKLTPVTRFIKLYHMHPHNWNEARAQLRKFLHGLDPEEVENIKAELEGFLDYDEDGDDGDDDGDDAGDEIDSLEDLDLDKRTINALTDAGYDIENIQEATLEDLIEIDGIGESTAEKVIEAVAAVFEVE